ncbi:MAG TPA: aconitase family protein, partial [Longimicrobiales bacterium]|nr:aconitase family protein [Longimicrobiales bacterium]
RTDAAAIWATGEFWWQIPRTIQVVLEGKLRPGVAGKDVIITLCGLYNHDEALNAAVEFAGPGVASLSMDARLTIANMSTEWGALVGWFPVDDVTIRYLRQRRASLETRGIQRLTKADIDRWAADPPAPDKDARYAARITLDLGTVTPHVSGPDSVQVMESVSGMAPEHVAIQKAYIVSCVNSRLEDLEAAARVLRGRKVADGVELYVAAASAEVQAAAEQTGAWGTLVDAGAKTLPPGCGPCIGLGTGLLEPGEVGISATNRNFKGRMGSRDAKAYLASPQVVAASAAAGYITDEGTGAGVDPGTSPDYRFERLALPVERESVEILDGFPERVVGRLVFLPKDNLNTDGIYGKDYTYKEGMTPEEMAAVVMKNYDPAFTERVHAGDILVGAANFGTGSSREQAATALKFAGIPLVIAASFSQTYLRNAYNNGYPCIEAPDFVEWLRELRQDDVAAGTLTVIPGDEVEVDFANSSITYRGESFGFPALGAVAQALVVAGGIEAQIRTVKREG